MAEYAITRSVVVDAPPESILPLIADFRRWRSWSPFEDQDPDLVREYRGPDEGVGAVYEYSGNARAGAGIMTITAASPEQVLVHLQFLRPFKSVSEHAFELTPGEPGTTVSWTMSWTQNPLLHAVLPLARMVGPAFEQGLAALKAAAEAPS